MHKGWDIERSNARVAHKTRDQGAGKESESSLSPSLATRKRDVATSPQHFLVVVRVRYLVNHCSLRQEFRGKIRAIYLLSNVHFGSTSPFSPISTLNNDIATVTRA